MTLSFDGEYRQEAPSMLREVYQLHFLNLFHASVVIMTDNTVSISLTSAIVYGVSGGFFLMLIIFLVMMSCDYDCTKR